MRRLVGPTDMDDDPWPPLGEGRRDGADLAAEVGVDVAGRAGRNDHLRSEQPTHSGRGAGRTHDRRG